MEVHSLTHRPWGARGASLTGLALPTEVAAPWTEETVKQCLYLYLALLPQNHRLIHELAAVYTEAIADIKRTVLRVIEQPVSGQQEATAGLRAPCCSAWPLPACRQEQKPGACPNKSLSYKQAQPLHCGFWYP